MSRRPDLAGLSLDELLALGICECGVSLADHPPLPRVAPLASWQAARFTPPELRSGSSLTGVRRMSDEALARRQRFAGRIVGRQAPSYVP